MWRCESCEEEYDRRTRKYKGGRITVCDDCAKEEADVDTYTGNMIYSHKGGASIQINKDPKLTKYINAATRLKNKGSNLGENLKVSAHYKTKSEGKCLKVADAFNYKNRDET
jgi:ribosome-binding protein aMBF1 (putative translation factor)